MTRASIAHRSSVLSLALFVVALAYPRVARAGGWDPEVQVTANTGDIYGEGLAASGSTVHIVYGQSQLLHRKSVDEGVTWSSDTPIDNGILHLTDPVVAEGDDVWVVYLKDIQTRSDWCCARELGNIYLAHSGDAGESWDAPQKLTTAQGAFRVSLTYASGRLHLVWMDYRDDQWDTYYLRSLDKGATWEPEKRIAISAGTFGAERPQVAAHGDGVHVTIWDDRGTNPSCGAGSATFTTCPDAFYLGSLDGGVTWGEEINVANSGAAFSGRNDIAVAGTSSVIINFNRAEEGTNDANPHLFTVHSPDDGATWDAPVQLTNTPGEADHGSIIGNGPQVHLAWHDSRDGHLAIYYVGSADEGVSWNPEEKVSTTTETDSSTPLVALTDGHLHVLWLDKRNGPFQPYYRRRALDVVSASSSASTGGGASTTGSGTGPTSTGSASSAGAGGQGGAASAGENDDPTKDESGCSCRTSSRGESPWALGALFGLALAHAARRCARR